MISIMLGLLSPNDPKLFRDNYLQRLYQSKRLGLAVGTTLLSELFPLPLKAHKRENWQPFYKERFKIDSFDHYLEGDDMKQRHKFLRNELTAPVIICYGKSSWNDFKNLFGGIQWKQGNSIEYGTGGQTFVVLTNHFTAHGGLYARSQEVIKIISENVPEITNLLTSDGDWLKKVLAEKTEK